MATSRPQQLTKSSIKDDLFPDRSVVELNSTYLQQFPITGQVLANVAYHDRLMLSNLSEEDYLFYLDEKIGLWNINVLGIDGLTYGTIAKLFFRLSKCNNKVKVLGIDNLLDDANEKSISLIYNNVVLWSSTQPSFFTTIICGGKISDTWKNRFCNLSNVQYLASELKQITKHILEVNFVNRNNSDHTINQLNSSLAAAQEESIRQTQLLQAQLQELFAKNQAMQQQLLLQEETQRVLAAKLAAAEAAVNASSVEISNLETDCDEKSRALTRAQDSSSKKIKKIQQEHQLTDAKLEQANKRVSQLETYSRHVGTLLDGFKQSRLFSAEPIVTESKEPTVDSLPSTKKRSSKKRKVREVSLIDESLSYAAKSLMNLLTIPASPLENDTTEEHKNETQPSDLHVGLQATLLRLVTQHKLNVNQPEDAFALYIEHEIKMCEKIFLEGKGFHEITSKEIYSVLYYLCFLVCNLHKKKNESTLPSPLNIYAYLNQTNVARTEDKKSLLHTLTRMSDAVIDVSEANMWLREGEIHFHEKIKHLIAQNETLNSQLAIAQAGQFKHAATSSPSSSPAAFFSNSAMPEEKKPTPARTENVTVTVTVSMQP